mgnify:CR=1 FL=1
MGKIYNVCLGKLVDKTPKWKTKGKKPEDFNERWEWFKKQSPMPQRISVCKKCNAKHYPKWRTHPRLCYKRHYKSVNSVGTC